MLFRSDIEIDESVAVEDRQARKPRRDQAEAPEAVEADEVAEAPVEEEPAAE